MNVLIIGDYHSYCGSCGQDADPEDTAHVQTLPGYSRDPLVDVAGCGVMWTHVAAQDIARSPGGAKKMRPDLIHIDQPVTRPRPARANKSEAQA